MTQPELFNVRQVGNLTFFETSRLAQGQEINTAPHLAEPPMPAPATSLPVGRITQLTTREPLPPFARHSETSRQAAIEKYDVGNAKNQRETIYRWIKFCGDKGATREEIQDKLGLSGDTVRPRVCELLGAAKGYTEIRITTKLVLKDIKGEKKLVPVTRKTKSKLDAEVLFAI